MHSSSKNYWSLIWQRFKKNRGARWSYTIFIGLLWISLLNPFLAGDVPIFIKVDGEGQFPIFHKYLIDLGLEEKKGNFLDGNYWHEQTFDQAIFPIIPYSAAYRDTKNIHFKAPFGPQHMEPNQAWHWLGTDQLGRDVAAGIIEGVPIALKVGLFSMFIATIIGLFMGGLGGYFGNDKLQLPLLTILLNILALFFAIHFAFISRPYQLSMEGGYFKSFGIFIGVFLLFNLLARLINQLPFLQKEVTLPLDTIVMRLIEVINSIPGLLLIIAFAAIFSTNSLWPVILIIGFFHWTGIARFFRAELLKVSNMEYIQASKALGFNDWRILFKHALPNAIGPVTILIAFGIARAVLTEATLAFLGIGTGPASQITWGSILQGAKGNPSIWWMAIFPGLAIFLTVYIFNQIGDGLKEATDAKDL